MKVSAATPPPYIPSGPIKPKQHKLAPEDEEIVNRLLREYEKEVANRRTTRTFCGRTNEPICSQTMKHKLIELENPPRKGEFVAVWKTPMGAGCARFRREGRDWMLFDDHLLEWVYVVKPPFIKAGFPAVFYK